MINDILTCTLHNNQATMYALYPFFSSLLYLKNTHCFVLAVIHLIQPFYFTTWCSSDHYIIAFSRQLLCFPFQIDENYIASKTMEPLS